MSHRKNNHNRIPVPVIAIGIVFFFIDGQSIQAFSAPRTDSLRPRLERLAVDVPALNEKVNISVTDVTVEEFLRAVANNAGLNLSIDPALNEVVANNFSNVRVLDMLLFLHDRYDIDLEIIGNIISIKKRPVNKNISSEPVGIKQDSIDHLFSLDYSQTSLNHFAKEVTHYSGKNVILAPGLDQVLVSGYIIDKPLEEALDKFAFSNNLRLNVTEDGFYILEPVQDRKERNGQVPQRDQRRQSQKKDNSYVLEVTVFNNGKIKVNAIDAPIGETIREVSEKTGNSYYFSSPVDGKISLQINGVEYTDFMESVLTGTPYIYRHEDGIYIIGDGTVPGLKEFRTVQLQNRTIEDIVDLIPPDLTDGLSISEFPELNSFLVNGPNTRVNRMVQFLNDIDKVVPVVLIDVIIVDVKKSYVVSTGMEAGIGDNPVEMKGQIFPEINVQMGSETINSIINNFNGFGWLNLGNVTPNFYMTLKAMEDQGVLNVRSTPRLSTLNSHEASISIGEMEYYLEEQSNIIGTQNPQVEKIQVYKSVNAELTVTIKPVVSGDEQITLNISVEQSDFTDRISKFAPPGSVTRKFESMIRVKNRDVILLGGLEEKSRRQSARGVPFLSRIPGLKWIFSSRTDERSRSKLSIFICPTIIG